MFGVRRWSNLILPLAVFLLLLIGVIGCGNGEEEVVDGEVNGEEDEIEVNGEEEIIDNGEEENGLTEYRYQFEGADTVDGVETKVAVIHENGEEVKIWLDVETQSGVQIEYDGEVIKKEEDEDQFGMTYGIFTQSMMRSMALLETFNPWNMVQGEEEGTEVRAVSTESKQFGDREAEVTQLEIQTKEPYFPDETYLCSVADFDGEFQLPVAWEYLGENGGTVEGEETPMEITSWPVPRDMFELIESYEMLEWKQAQGEGFIDITLEITDVVPR